MIDGLVVVNSRRSLLVFQRKCCIAFITVGEERRGNRRRGEDRRREERRGEIFLPSHYRLSLSFFFSQSTERYTVVIHVVFAGPSLVKHL